MFSRPFFLDEANAVLFIMERWQEVAGGKVVLKIGESFTPKIGVCVGLVGGGIKNGRWAPKQVGG